MIRSAVAADPILAQLTQAIVSHVRPRRIVLFGSRARGDARPDSDYDVMVEEELEPENERTRVHEIAGGIPQQNGVNVQITVRTFARFERRKDDVGTIDYDIAREGIVLYADPAISGISDLRPSARVREEPEKPSESLTEWIEAANVDLWVIDTLVAAADVKWEPVAFHCQQATEKYLKAALVNRHVKPPRTHELAVLLLQANSAGHPTEGLEAACAQLSVYAVDARYPRVRVDESEGQQAVSDGRRIVDQVQRWLSAENSGP